MKTPRSFCFAVFASLMLVAGTSLHAQTDVYYVGPTSGNDSWTHHPNWTGGIAPTTTAFNAIINNGGNVSVPFTAIALNNLTIGNGSISGSQLAVDGLITLNNGATVSNALYAKTGIVFGSSVTINQNGLVNGLGGVTATATWDSGTLFFTNSSAVHNEPNSIWNANSGLYDSVSGSPTFGNGGVFNKNTVSTLTIEPVFNQGSTGTLNVNSGELQLLGGGSHQGYTNVLNGTTLTLAGTHLFAGGSFPGAITVNSLGTLNVSGGTTTISFAYDHVGTATVASGAALNLTSSGTHSGVFTTASGGTVNFNSGTHTFTNGVTNTGAGAFNINFPSTAQLPSGATLSGGGTVTLNGGTLSVTSSSSIVNPFVFSSGFISGGGTLRPDGNSTFSGPGNKQINNGTTFNVGDGVGAAGSSTAEWKGGTIDLRDAGSINVKADGAFTTDFDGTMNNGAGTQGIFNVEAGGSFTKNGGAGTTSIATNGNAFAFKNNGTVNVQTGTLLIGSVSVGGTHGGTFDVSNLATLNLAGAHTLGAGTSFTGAGTSIFSGTITANVTVPVASALSLTGTLTGTGTVNVTGPAAWSNGFMSGSGTTNILNSIVFTTGNDKDINGRVLNIGDGVGGAGSVTADFTAGSIDLYNGGTLNIKADGAFTTNFDGSIRNSGGPAGTVNVEAGGSFTKSGGTGISSIATNGNPFNFNNAGTVNVQTGTLQIAGSGSNSGAWNIEDGAVLNFGVGSRTMIAGTTVSAPGTGNVQFSSGTTTFNAGTYAVNGATVFNGGTASFNNTATTNALNFSGGTLTGTGTLNVTGAASLTGDTFMTSSGTTNILGSISLTGTSTNKQLTSGRILNIGDGVGAAGSTTATWTGGTLDIRDGARLNIKADASFTSDFSGTTASTIINNGGGAQAIVTVEAGGSFTKTGGTGTLSVGTNSNSLAFHNNGTVNVQTGTLHIGTLSNGGTHTGAFNVSSGATLHLGGVHSLNAGTSFTGAGTTMFSGYVASSATVTIATAFNNYGTLDGSGTVNVTGPANWLSGFMSGSGTTNIHNSILFSSSNDKDINGRVLNIQAGATGSHTEGNIDIYSGGSLNIKSGAAFTASSSGSIFNSGGPRGFINVEAGSSFTKNGAGITTTITNSTNPLTFGNTGTVNVDGGTLSFGAGATITQHSGSTLTGGTWNVRNGSNLSFTTGSNITTIGSAASVMLDGAGSSFTRLTNGLSNNQGSFTIKNDRDLTTAGAYTNSGTTRVEDSTTTMTIGAGGSAAYTQTGGVTALVNGAFIDPSVFNLNGGTLKGNGTIESSVIAGPGSNTIAPGMSPGTLTINGSLTLSSGSTLAMELGGLTQGSLYDFLDVNGVLTLAGMLDLDFINDFQNSLNDGDILTLATANSAILGSFSNVTSGGYLLTNFPIALQVFYGTGSPYGAENLVVAIPEPSRALLTMLGAASLMLRRRRITERT